ncbi:hypothetical protein AN286_05135 [Aliarcobacter cryaerophilus ATCC 43158]|uniref:Membrane protein n=1 Tax=Aliarcobacter cryaerophilus ATCC 43158 TaxID=1032070 RepID=A0AAD0TW98_9BACT|nr:hypothetical protein [Aliarcobacter cryaerophilus]AYJ79558.1 putative membrane protein [Aliarcobacter cryaerophilus ATCC 43158]PRM97007.1 hypothetical protein CJ667_06455 [Aliarcobacter cryaerophilus]QCZ23805.1 hypothetical protein AN286_05135 [Aliarcobacter cryaerophilus ATCC 43158]
MQSKKKFNTLLPTLKKRCCFLKFIDFEPIVKYGSIFIILLSIFIQSSNIIQNKNLILSTFSLFFNLFFLLIILQKLEMIKIDFLNIYIKSSLQFLIFIYILNSFLYLFINNSVYSYIYAPINLFGAYFIFLLLRKEDIT